MRKRRDTSRTNNFKIVFVFCGFVGVLLLFSVIFKSVVIFSKSNFDGTHRFTVAIEQEKEKTTILSFSPQTRSISLLHIISVFNKTKPELKLPIDAFVKTQGNNTLNRIESKTVSSSLLDIARNYHSITTELTMIDLLRLFLFSRTVSQHDIQSGELRLPVDDLAADRLIASLFTDTAIAEEKLSIEVVNGTSISGLGNRLGRYIANMGGNVVAISTADSVQKESKIVYAGNKTYTVEKLGKLLRFPVIAGFKPGISDVVVVVGTDKEGELVF